MKLAGVDILNFKNIAGEQLRFSPNVNCVLGHNGMGKSNLLEAVHYLSFLRGFRSMPDTAYIRHNQEQMMLKGAFVADDETYSEVSVGIVAGKRKSVKCDGKDYDRQSSHIGRFPVVLVAPHDSDLVAGGAEERRRFMDMVISQADNLYLIHLMRYNRALESRNRMLRSGIRDAMLFESVEAPLIESAHAIFATRQKWVDAISPIFETYYKAVAGGEEKAGLNYKSALHQSDFKEILLRNSQRDATLGFTSSGIHRDDIDATLNDFSMRRLGSQGQIKSYTVALKFAVYEYLKNVKATTPILLLDDIFDKLDASRVERIMEIVASDSFGQIFVTDTNREHLDKILHGLDARLLLEAENGTFHAL